MNDDKNVTCRPFLLVSKKKLIYIYIYMCVCVCVCECVCVCVQRE